MHKLDEQKERYSVDLDETLQQYKWLKSQVADADSDDIQRNAITAASVRLQQTYEKHFNAQLYRESQKEVAAMLGETISKKSIREQLAHAPAYHNVKPQREQPQR